MTWGLSVNQPQWMIRHHGGHQGLNIRKSREDSVAVNTGWYWSVIFKIIIDHQPVEPSSSIIHHYQYQTGKPCLSATPCLTSHLSTEPSGAPCWPSDGCWLRAESLEFVAWDQLWLSMGPVVAVHGTSCGCPWIAYIAFNTWNWWSDGSSIRLHWWWLCMMNDG